MGERVHRDHGAAGQPHRVVAQHERDPVRQTERDSRPGAEAALAEAGRHAAGGGEERLVGEAAPLAQAVRVELADGDAPGVAREVPGEDPPGRLRRIVEGARDVRRPGTVPRPGGEAGHRAYAGAGPAGRP